MENVVVLMLYNNSKRSIQEQTDYRLDLITRPPSSLSSSLQRRRSSSSADSIKRQNGDASALSAKTTLYGKRILFEITTVGMEQFQYFEGVLDGVRDLCEAGEYGDDYCSPFVSRNRLTSCHCTVSTFSGANVSVHIITSDCDTSQKHSRCKGTGKKGEEPYPSTTILSLINEKLNCPLIEDVTMYFYASTWGKYLVDFHRQLFYKHLGKYDVYIHTEGDTVIRPTNVATYLRETNGLKQLTGKSFADYSIGFMRYEQSTTERVIWEFKWPSSLPETSLKGYTTTPGKFHHQGMYMATSEQLALWKDRCQFDEIQKHSGYHREHVSGGMELYDGCNVTQLLPLDCIYDLLVHHLPDKNHKRRPSTHWKSTIELVRNKHTLQQQQQQQQQSPSFLRGTTVHRPQPPPPPPAYQGIKLVLEDVDPINRPITDFNVTPYLQYFSNGGRLVTATN
jgi:hypothetical protein